MLLRISSGWGSCGWNHPPASSPTIFNPARARGSTASPPAAPKPITTTSVFRSLMGAMGQLLFGHSGFGDLGIHLLHLCTHEHSGTGISDQVPSRKVHIATIRGITEHSFQSMLANQVERSEEHTS